MVIPKDMRDYLGLKIGSKLIFRIKNHEIVIVPQTDAEQFVEEFCSAVPKKLKKKINIEKIYQAQIEERIL